jgi:flagellar motor switch protein FliG
MGAIRKVDTETAMMDLVVGIRELESRGEITLITEEDE